MLGFGRPRSVVFLAAFQCRSREGLAEVGAGQKTERGPALRTAPEWVRDQGAQCFQVPWSPAGVGSEPSQQSCHSCGYKEGPACTLSCSTVSQEEREACLSHATGGDAPAQQWADAPAGARKGLPWPRSVRAGIRVPPPPREDAGRERKWTAVRFSCPPAPDAVRGDV